MEKEEAGGDGVGVNLVELFHAFAKLHCFLLSSNDYDYYYYYYYFLKVPEVGRKNL